MDKLMEYRNLIKRILRRYVESFEQQTASGIESFLVTDDEQSNYIWFDLGWEGHKRVKNITVFVRLRNGKFWIEEDWTEEGIASDLLAAGVPKEDIVLAFHSPEKRPFTEFAVA